MARSTYETLYKGLMNINEDGCWPYGRLSLDGDQCIKCDTPTHIIGCGDSEMDTDTDINTKCYRNQ